jgi:hypothetical protein
MITSIIKSNVSTAFQINGEDLWIPLPNHSFASEEAVQDFVEAADSVGEEKLTGMFTAVFKQELEADISYGQSFEDVTNYYIQKH